MSDYKPHVVIDEQKNIILPEELKNHMVQYDHNVKTITFDCPRYSDGRDLSTMRIYVNYFRKSGEKDADRCENITVDSVDNNLIHFEWVPKRSATLEQGVLAFLICAEKEDAGGNQENAWHTKLCKDLKIAEGMDCLNAVIEKYPTIITYLLTRMEDVESIATPEAMQAYVNQYLRNYPPSGMTEEERALLEENFALTKQIQEDLASTIQSKADAIICEAEGTTIVATDSSDAGFEELHLYGKSKQGSTTGAQLLDLSQYEGVTSSGVTLAIDDDYISINGTGTAEYITFDIPCFISTGTPIYMYVVDGDINNIHFYYRDSDKNLIGEIIPSHIGVSKVFDKDIDFFRIRCKQATYDTRLKILITTKENAPYEPYTGGKPSPNPEYQQEVAISGKEGSVDVKVCGAQLFDVGNITDFNASAVATEFTKDGMNLTFTSKQEYHQIGMIYSNLPSGIYTFGYHSQTNNANAEVSLRAYYSLDGAVTSIKETTKSNFITFDYDSSKGDLKICTRPNIANTTITYTGLMLCEGTTLLPWEPYIEQTLTLQTPNGLPGIPLGTTIPDVIKNSPIHMSGVYLDSEEGQYYIADTKNENGRDVQRIYEFDGCDIKWLYNSNQPNRFYGNTQYSIIGVLGMSNHFKPSTWGMDYGYFGFGNYDVNKIIYLKISEDITTAEQAQEWFSNNETKFYAVLATPIETPLSDEEILAYKALHTNKPNTTIMNSDNAYMKVKYVADTKNHIKQNYIPLSKYTALEERVAAIEELVIS